MKANNLFSFRVLLFLLSSLVIFFTIRCAVQTVKKTEIAQSDTTATYRLYKMARNYLENNDFEQCLEMLYTIVDDFPEDELADDALFLIAEVLSDPKNPEQDLDTAISELERLIEDYPKSEYVARAKKMIKKLEKLLEE